MPYNTNNRMNCKVYSNNKPSYGKLLITVDIRNLTFATFGTGIAAMIPQEEELFCSLFFWENFSRGCLFWLDFELNRQIQNIFGSNFQRQPLNGVSLVQNCK